MAGADAELPALTAPDGAAADEAVAAVLAAVAEFDALGRSRFPVRTGAGRAARYVAEVDGRLYDAGALLRRALGTAAGDATGDKVAAERLRRLGFTVRVLRDPGWSRDEVVLACALVEAQGWRPLHRERREVLDLSALLQSTAIHPLDGRTSGFRSPAEVSRRTHDLAAAASTGSAAGNGPDTEVVGAFRSRPGPMRREAEAIRTVLGEWGDGAHGLRDPDLPGPEAGALLRMHLRRERKPALRRRKADQVRARGGAVVCEVCGLDPVALYGELGADLLECHHRPPPGAVGPTQTHVDDLALVCPTCHRVLHRSNPWPGVEELAGIVRPQVR